ncbi:MAG: protein kinase [Archangium sp.]|nr:protein kinase [Archangium sp.]
MAVFICQGCGAEHSSWGGKCPQCGTSETIRLAPATDRMVDRVVKGKFKIIRKLGQGGMGAVYLAEQLGIGHRVALKFLKSEFSSDAEIARRFLNEAKSYARVAHPNAVALHDFGQDDEGNLFIAMEYCEGVDLKKVIAEQGRLPMIEAIEIVLQVADVLANAHEKGVIHRDLKPENIMIRRGIRGVHAKVLDFGIARLMDAGTKLTVAGAIAGTPRYMSPEQVEGKEVDARADIYSLGVVLFESLTGRQPFDGTTISEILRKQVTQPLPALASFAPDLDYPDLEAVLQRACLKPTDGRWPDMLSFASALSQAIPTQAHLSLPPLQRSNTNVRAVATPLPGSNLSGIATPGTEVDAASTDRTLMKTGEASAVARKPSQPLAQTIGELAPRGEIGELQLDGRPGHSTQIGDASLPPTVPKSKAPLFVVGAVVLALLGGVGYLVTRPDSQQPVVVKNDPPPVKDPVVEPPRVDPGAEALKLLREQEARSREENARMSLGKGKTEFEVAKLDEAETYLKSVAPESEASVEAKALLEKIGTIREKLKLAGGLRAKGQCDQALPLFKAVLALNSRVKDAIDGAADCRRSMVDPTME